MADMASGCAPRRLVAADSSALRARPIRSLAGSAVILVCILAALDVGLFPQIAYWSVEFWPFFLLGSELHRIVRG